MSIDTRGRDAAEALQRAAEQRSPVPPPAVLTRRRRRRAVARLALSSAALVVVVALVWHSQPARDPTGTAGVWVASWSQNLLLHVDPARNKVVGVVPYRGVLADFSVGDGVVWALVRNLVTDSHARLLKIDPRSNRIVKEIPLRLRSFASAGLVAMPGSVWLLDNGLLRFDEASGRFTTVLPSPPFTLHTALAAGDRLWAIDGFEVLQIDPAAGKVVTRTPHSGPRIPSTSSLAVGAGAAWLVVDGGDVQRIDPLSGRVVAHVRVEADVQWVAASGQTVVATSATHLFVIDPRSNRVAATVALPDPSFSAPPTLDADAVWIFQPHGGGLLRIDSSLR
jgi:hypothetical protein